MLDQEVEKSDEYSEEAQKFKIRKGVYLLPNLITSGSLFAGFYSIIASLDGNFELAAYAIFISAVLDGLDGRVARLTKSSSKFGMEYDSLADLVAFGLAPAILAFTWELRPFGRYGWLAAFLFVVCGALRLARFNVQITTVESRRFNGLPIPAAASFLAATVLIFHYFGYSEAYRDVTILAEVYLLAFLMVSTIKYYSFKELNLAHRMPFGLLVAIVFLLILVAAEPQIMIFVLTFGYVISGPIGRLFEMRKGALEKGRAAEQKRVAEK